MRRTINGVFGVIVLSGLPALASGEGGGAAQALITPNYGTIFWTFLTFLLMVLILGKFAWKPMLGALQAREQSIQDSIEQARKGQQEAERILAEQREALAEAHRQRAAALEEGRQDAEALKAEMLGQARKQREQLLKQTEEQVEAGLRQARGELRTIAVDLAIKAAEKLISKNLDDSSQRKLVEEYLADLEQSGSVN